MEFIDKTTIKINKVLNELDKLALDFTKILNQLDIKYVIISGYVSILFGRSRASEDIDIILEDVNFKKFNELWNLLYQKFECINTTNVKEAYESYLTTKHAIRFCYKEQFIPNMEIKFPKTDLDTWTLNERKKVIMNNNQFFISPIELQIPFKLFLGSEKDIEDAKYLYSIFKNKLDMSLLHEFNRKLKIEQLFNKHLR
ncbi:MAG: hypothetical protein KKF46_07295 [Nanoarchaeota archaeon]|nr:hypothetical protein [Nanoarchaeota archaeon]MBU1322133.1 hypothetical protein [Nanoarchaeota archaeon]MBU1597601.1 hypothetical protein [Nanoarchaeota archaeon]MBU2442093.1 hypothetical protein [Nanoarchaeota archaeon]